MTAPSIEPFWQQPVHLHPYLWAQGRLRALWLPGGGWAYMWREILVAVALNGTAATPYPVPGGAGVNGGQYPVYALTEQECRLLSVPVTVLQRLPQVTVSTDRLRLRQHVDGLCSCATDIAALPVQQLIKKAGIVPVTVADAYAAGSCWYGTLRWQRAFWKEQTPTVAQVLHVAPHMPEAERQEFYNAVYFAIAYTAAGVWAGTPLTAAHVAEAIAAGRKAGSSDGILSRSTYAYKQFAANGFSSAATARVARTNTPAGSRVSKQRRQEVK